MSSGTSADERPEDENDDSPPVGTRLKDGAIICKHPMDDGGRCGKLLLTPDKELVCANGHAVSLEQVRDALLMDPKADLSSLMLFQVQEEEIWRAILKRVTSSEFAPKELSLNSRFLFAPTVFSALLSQADRLDAKAASDLRAYWEIHMNAHHRQVWEWIAKAGSKQNHAVRRERAIAAYAYWENPSLPGLLMKHGLLQQVTQDLRQPENGPELETLNEILLAIEDTQRTALIFCGRRSSDSQVEFDLRVDPENVSQEFGCWRKGDLVFRSQLKFSFQPEPMTLNVYPRDDLKAIAWFQAYMRQAQPAPCNEVAFEPIPNTTLFSCALHEAPKHRTPLPAYDLGYQVIRAFVETYGLRRRPDWG